MNKLQKAWDNYKKPTPRKFRKKGDWALLIGFLALIAQITDTVSFLLENPKIQVWVGDNVYASLLSFCALFSIVYKFYTNFKKDKENPD